MGNGEMACGTAGSGELVRSVPSAQATQSALATQAAQSAQSAQSAQPAQSAHAAQPVRIHATVGGMVQGVGYRYFTVTTARKLGLTGWVRNLMNGDVELEAQGDRSSIAMLISQLKLGPKWSDVERIGVDEVPLRHGEHDFRVRGY